MDPRNCYFEYWIIHVEFWLFLLTDIPYNSDSHKILEMVYVRYVLSTDELILETVAIFLQKAGLV